MILNSKWMDALFRSCFIVAVAVVEFGIFEGNSNAPFKGVIHVWKFSVEFSHANLLKRILPICSQKIVRKESRRRRSKCKFYSKVIAEDCQLHRNHLIK